MNLSKQTSNRELIRNLITYLRRQSDETFYLSEDLMESFVESFIEANNVVKIVAYDTDTLLSMYNEFINIKYPQLNVADLTGQDTAKVLMHLNLKHYLQGFLTWQNSEIQDGKLLQVKTKFYATEQVKELLDRVDH